MTKDAARFTALLLTLALAALGAQSAGAAKPPSGRTYLVALIGLEERYDIRHQCLEFGPAEVCSLDGDLCGSWRAIESRGKETAFDFAMSTLDGTEPVGLEGLARVDSRGNRSSIGGTGSHQGARPFNFSFVGRETTREQCLDLLGGVSTDDEPVIGSGHQATETRAVSGFHSVRVSGVGRLILEQTGSESLTVTADDNILPLVTTEVVDGQLRIATEGSFSTRNPITYRLTVRELDEMVLSGAAIAEATRLDGDLLRVTVTGASVVSAAGVVDHQIVRLTGACGYQAEKLDSRVATVHLAGASVAVVRVRELLEGSVAGASLLEYNGNPRVDVAVAMPARVHKVGD